MSRPYITSRRHGKDSQAFEMKEIEVPSGLELSPVSRLDFSDRTSSVLSRAGVITLQDLVDFRSRGYKRGTKGRGINTLSIREIEQKLSGLANIDLAPTSSIFPSSENSHSFLVELDEIDVVNIVRLAIPFARRLLECKDRQRAYDILRRRHGLDGSKSYTLEEIGEYYGLTRERIRQIQSRSEKLILNVLLGRESLKRWRIQERLHEEASMLHQQLNDLGEVFAEDEAQRFIMSRYNMETIDRTQLRFVLSVFGFEPLSKNQTGLWDDPSTVWAQPESSLPKNIGEIIRDAKRLLEKNVMPVEFFEIRIRLNKKRKAKLNDQQIRSSLRVCPEIEQVGDDHFQTKFEYLSSLADKAYRVLSERGHPLHIREIARLINKRLASVGRNTDVQVTGFHGQLIADARFEPVGRSGRWSLSEWAHVRRDNIVDLMKEYFHYHQSKATAASIHAFVETKRPGVPKKSVYTLLKLRPDLFAQVSETEYELAAWGTKRYEPTRPWRSSEELRDLILRSIDEIFSGQVGNTMPLAQFARRLAEKTGNAEQTIRNRLPSVRSIEIISDASYHGRNKLVRYIGIRDQERMPESERNNTHRTIAYEVTRYLEDQDGLRARVADIALHVVRVVGCKRPTFYKHLSTMQNIVKEKEGSTLFCCLKPLQREDKLSFPQISMLKDSSLLDDLSIALGNLNLHNVDAGLFQLGKIFENELRAFLEEAKSKNSFVVTRRDLDKLSSMIDCVVNNRIISKGHHLTLLREKRNERAHDKMPTLEERKKLMQHAPFLADLYVEYILSLHQARLAL